MRRRVTRVFIMALAMAGLLNGCAAGRPKLPPWQFVPLDAGAPKSLPGITFLIAGNEANAARRIRNGIKVSKLHVGHDAPGWIAVYTTDGTLCDGDGGLSVPCSMFWIVSYKSLKDRADSTQVSIAAWEERVAVGNVFENGALDLTKIRAMKEETVIRPGSRNWGRLESLGQAIAWGHPNRRAPRK